MTQVTQEPIIDKLERLEPGEWLFTFCLERREGLADAAGRWAQLSPEQKGNWADAAAAERQVEQLSRVVEAARELLAAADDVYPHCPHSTYIDGKCPLCAAGARVRAALSDYDTGERCHDAVCGCPGPTPPPSPKGTEQ